jgi:hypothetical protein
LNKKESDRKLLFRQIDKEENDGSLWRGVKQKLLQESNRPTDSINLRAKRRKRRKESDTIRIDLIIFSNFKT